MPSDFERDIATAINRACKENGSNTPDFILADYLNNCLEAFNKATIWRAKWFDARGVPEAERENGPQPPHRMGSLGPQPAMRRVLEATTASEAKDAVGQLKRGWSDQDHGLLKDAEQSLHPKPTE